MARTIGSIFGLSKQTEMLFMTLVTLCINIFDMTLFEIGNNLEQVWSVPFDVTKFSPQGQHVIKILLSGVVFVRTFSLHLYIAFLIAIFWPCFLGTRPTLMLPWLMVSAIKNIGTGVITFATGIYTCVIYGPFRPACFRFVGSQILDLSPSLYMWVVGISLYRDLVKPPEVDKEEIKMTEEKELNVALRRRKVKSMIDEEILRKQIESQRNFNEMSPAEEQEIFSLSKIEKTLKTKLSRSLGSLLDAMISEAQTLSPEDHESDFIDKNLDISEQAAKLLGISNNEIDTIKQSKQTKDLPIYPVDDKKKQKIVANFIYKEESPLYLLPKTSMYSPYRVKQLRPNKSELQIAKEFSKLKTSLICENENSPNYYNTEHNKSPIFHAENYQNDNNRTRIWKQESEKFTNKLKILDNKSELKNINEENEQFFSTKCELYDIKNVSESIVTDHSIRSLSSNEKQKSSEEIIANTDYTDCILESSENTPLETQTVKLISKKISHEIACQVSTLSKRILNASPEQLSTKSSNEKKNKTITIKPPSTHSYRNRPISSKSHNSRQSPRDNSYLNIHLHKLELGGGIENLEVDKFTVIKDDSEKIIYNPLVKNRQNSQNVS